MPGRAAECREGWHLEDEPELTPDKATGLQQHWVALRAEAQQMRDQAATAGRDTTDLNELIRELDAEITKAGVRGKVAPEQKTRRRRSTRRRQDAPDLPKRKVSARTVGKTYTAPDGKPIGRLIHVWSARVRAVGRSSALLTAATGLTPALSGDRLR